MATEQDQDQQRVVDNFADFHAGLKEHSDEALLGHIGQLVKEDTTGGLMRNILAAWYMFQAGKQVQPDLPQGIIQMPSQKAKIDEIKAFATENGYQLPEVVKGKRHTKAAVYNFIAQQHADATGAEVTLMDERVRAPKAVATVAPTNVSPGGTDYNKMNIKELKELAKARGISLGGATRKSDIVARITGTSTSPTATVSAVGQLPRITAAPAGVIPALPTPKIPSPNSIPTPMGVPSPVGALRTPGLPTPAGVARPGLPVPGAATAAVTRPTLPVPGGVSPTVGVARPTGLPLPGGLAIPQPGNGPRMLPTVAGTTGRIMPSNDDDDDDDDEDEDEDEDTETETEDEEIEEYVD